MLNQTVLVGRIVKDPTIKETNNGKKVTNLTLAVPRAYKNENGEYDTDFLNCILWQGVAQNTTEYCKKGDLVGIKGHLQSDSYEKDGKKVYSMTVVGEKVTFLSSYKDKYDDKEQEEAFEF